MQRNKLPIESTPDAPGFETLWWDNIKTTGFYSGAVTGSVAGFAGGAAGTGLGLMLFITCIPAEQVVGALAIGGAAITGAPVAAVGGGIGATLLSIPAAITAKLTRKFKSNADITPYVDAFADHTEDQKYILNEISNKYTNQYLQNLPSFPSYESLSLIKTLDDTKKSVKKKWGALIAYMSEKDYQTKQYYVNNGKRLFNIILDTFVAMQNEINLLNAIDEGSTNAATDIIQNNPGMLDNLDSNGMSFLHRAVLANNVKAIDFAIKNNFDLDLLVTKTNHKDNGKTALQLASELGHTEIVKKLLNSRAACKFARGLHPIYIAAQNGQLETVKALVEMDRNIYLEKQDNFNQTPLLWAAANGHKEVVEYLITQKANLEVRTYCQGDNNHNSAAYQWAYVNGHTEITKLLLNDARAHENDIARLRKNLKNVVSLIQDNAWEQEGWGLFGNSLPDGVKAARKYIEETNPQNLSIDKLSPYSVFTFAVGLESLEFSPNTLGYRSKNTANLYASIKNINGNIDADLNEIPAFRNRERQVLPENTVARI